MTVSELIERLAKIDAYAVVQKDRISIQIERNGRPLRDGWFNGLTSEIEATLAQAEARAAEPNPADVEYLSWNRKTVPHSIAADDPAGAPITAAEIPY